MKNKRYPLYPVQPVFDLREMIEEKAKNCPDEIAFRYMLGRKTMVERTYAQFYEDVRALGTYLLKHYTVGQKIAILGENSYQWLVAYFAIVTTGNVAVLVAKDSSQEEAAALVAHSEANILLASKACEKTLQYCKQQFGRKKKYASMTHLPSMIEYGKKAMAKGKTYYDTCKTDPNALCSIFFTSGSTGFSKGVMLSQANMLCDVFGALQIVKPGGSCMSVLPFTHCFGLIVSLMVPFQCQIPIFLCSSIANFMREIPIAKPTLLALVPLFVETFYKTIWRTAEKNGQEKTLRRGMKASDALLKIGVDKRRDLFKDIHKKFGGNLEMIICGGAPLDPRYVKEFRSLGVQILNGYGITECSPVLACNRNNHWNDESVGQLLPNIQVIIDQPDKKGIGEVLAKGDNVMLGYYNDSDATAQVIDSEGWFHTGDMGFIDKDGFLHITGRKKSLIILSNGENVSPEELETYVDRIDEVNEVVVYADDNTITAEIYPDETLGLSWDELIRRIQQKVDALNKSLPNHKHINKVKFRDTEFEKTSTRKIKRYKAAPKKEKKEEND
ncbi:MAG: AMP-binding protein [Oscillospiraceae bacterium]|nr:AMP-binding protein [Oscillospiraceae bacterium]